MNTPSGPARRGAPEVRRLRVAFLVVLAVWVVAPFLLTTEAAPDGTAFVAAAKIIRSDTDAAFAVQFQDADPTAPRRQSSALFDRWNKAYCDTDPTSSCDTIVASFISPPPASLVYVPMAALPPVGGILVVRLLVGVLFAVGMDVLWRLLDPRDERMALLLVVTAVLATPIVINVMILGQNTQFLFVAASLGLTATTSRWRRVALVASLAVAIMLKLFPALLLGVLLLTRRWRLAAATVAVLAAWTLLSVVVIPMDAWTAFRDGFLDYREGAIPFRYNRSFVSMLHGTVMPGLRRGSLATGILGAQAVAVVAYWWARVRHCDDDVLWGYGWLAAVFLNDYVWPHYLVLLVPAAAFVVHRRRELAVLLPVAAAASLPALGTWDAGPGLGQVITSAILLAGLVGLPLVARPATTPRSTTAAAVS